MDDFKCHTATKKGLKILTEELRRSARELGLVLNENKCGFYSGGRQVQDGEDEEPSFLPEVRRGYKYLGLEQLERDTKNNFETIEEKIKQLTSKICKSQLTTGQKAKLFNSTVVSSAIYVMGNIYPDEKRASTLKRCRDLDKEVRKILVETNLKGRTTSNAHIYIPASIGGMGLWSIELEAEIQYIRRGIYIKSHPEMKETMKMYEKLQQAGWRNPLGDHDAILGKYGCPNITV
ncbi:uncharacterized protein LOC123311016 [Coccinella septempunctata]|uniref:uncharacterized protein LOC123311016 n=1 Tax=Coccinella septempunctata TaxID=41139 RepID=UPI001D086465|nr:uncharacterized protein LOC123311016 [Coccinella septempunctata]